MKDHAADVAAADSKGHTALHVACAAGSTPLVEAFKAASSNFLKLVNTVDAAGQTALFSAVAVGAVDIVQILLESGGRVDAKDNAGATVLHLVVRRHVERRRDGIDYLQLAVILLRKVRVRRTYCSVTNSHRQRVLWSAGDNRLSVSVECIVARLTVRRPAVHTWIGLRGRRRTKRINRGRLRLNSL